MTLKRVKYMLLTVAFIILYRDALCQESSFGYSAQTGAAISSGNNLPFWFQSNSNGVITEDTYLWQSAALFKEFKESNTRVFDYSLKASATGALGKEENRLFVNELYGRVRWQNLVLDLGAIDKPIEYNGLSSTNGNLIYSNNTRAIPGISLSTWEYIKLPYVGKWLAFKGKYSEYLMVDNRYADRTRLHNKMFAIRVTPIPQLSIEGGLEHYAQWGGETPDYGVLPHTFSDYIRIVKVEEGGEGSPANEVNKLGNHIGMHFGKIKYSGKKWDAELFYGHQFEDGSGQRFENFPDGLYGVYLNRKENNKWLNAFIYEYTNSMDQSGPYHNDPQTGVVVGGNDNYFNNSIYRSGWTYYGNVIGSPFFTTNEKDSNGQTLGVYNSRIIAHHIGVSGTLPLDIVYKLMSSYSLNYGTHSLPFTNEEGESINKPQYSFGLELAMPEGKLPFETSLNIGFDRGELLENNWGVMIKIIKTGLFKHK